MYKINNHGEITDYEEPIGSELVIPSVIDGKIVKEIGLVGSVIAKKLKRVVIPKTVTRIGEHAFLNCAKLEEVVFEEDSQLTTIMEEAFKGCWSLKSFPFEEMKELANIRAEAFAHSGLEKADLSQTNIWTIGNNSFSTSKLESVLLPRTLTFIGKSAFEGTSITDIDLSVVSNSCEIYDSAFSYTPIVNINFSDDKVLNIFGSEVFSGCDCIKKLVIPAKVIIYGEACFEHCYSLEAVHFLSGDKFEERDLPAHTFCCCEKLKDVYIDFLFDAIGNNAFEGCESLVKMNFPETVKNIGNCAFNCCFNLKEVDLSNCKVEMIGKHSFASTSFNIDGFILDYFSCAKFRRTSLLGNDNIDLAEVFEKYPFCCIV